MEANLEDALGALLSDPAAMEKVKTMARSLGLGDLSPAGEQASSPEGSPLRKLTALEGLAGIDHNQQCLLEALSPYLSRSRIHKLEKAMRAAHMASAASVFLGSGGSKLLTGR